MNWLLPQLPYILHLHNHPITHPIFLSAPCTHLLTRTLKLKIKIFVRTTSNSRAALPVNISNLQHSTQPKPENMDWFSWLSKTSLEPSVAYEYCLLFRRNELEAEDLGHFNHEFLQSMGISVAKHRLEILKLSRKEVGPAGPISISKLVLAFKATRNSIKKCVTKCVFFHELKGEEAFTKKMKSEEQHQEVLKKQSTRKAKSGPLDRRVKENWMVGDGTRLKLSGPSDRKAHERLVFSYKSPNKFMSSRSSNKTQVPQTSIKKGRERVEMGEFISKKDSIPTLWATLFQDMEPT